MWIATHSNFTNRDVNGDVVWSCIGQFSGYNLHSQFFFSTIGVQEKSKNKYCDIKNVIYLIFGFQSVAARSYCITNGDKDLTWVTEYSVLKETHSSHQLQLLNEWLIQGLNTWPWCY